MREVLVQISKRYVILKCDAGDEHYRIGDLVVINTKEGPKIGKVLREPLERNSKLYGKQIHKVLRLATDADIKESEDREKKATEALTICKQKIEKLQLSMKLVDVNFKPGGEKITFYFVAESRVNFRELVKQLAATFHTRIEMRQIGARNESKIKGGIGCCGRPLCCSLFLSDFVPVTVRMAKDQGLPLDPTKISGLCGRLLCCLAYEASTYSEMKGSLPKLGSRVVTEGGVGKVIKHNILEQTLQVQLEDGRQVNVMVDEIKSRKK